MPPRFAYWTIIIDDAPTAFRARDREELIPTYRQLLARNPNAAIKWFARGKLWESPEQARAAIQPPREPRGPDWRPGGRHQDPRARFDKRSGTRNAPKGGSREGTRQSREGERPSHEGKRRKAPPAFGKAPAGTRKRSFDDKRARPQGGPRDPKWHPRTGGFKGGFGGRGGKAKRFQPRDARSKHRAGERPGEAKPPESPPPRPPGPDRPPKPGHEPGPSTPEPETIRILPEPPERAK